MSSDPLDQPAGLGDRLDDLLLQAEAWIARSRTVVVAALVIGLAIALVWWAAAQSGPEEPIEASIPLATAPAVTSADGGVDLAPPVDGGAPRKPSVAPEPDEELVVHVVGAVRRPGLVTLSAGDRISDAVAGAGGGAPDADLARLNLASPVIDGMQIRVPVLDADDPAEEPLIQLPSVGPSSGLAGPSATRDPLDLNRATEAELEALPGIGPALAARIVEWRTGNGGFAVVDDLESVPGIGPAKLADLRDLVVV